MPASHSGQVPMTTYMVSPRTVTGQLPIYYPAGPGRPAAAVVGDGGGVSSAHPRRLDSREANEEWRLIRAALALVGSRQLGDIEDGLLLLWSLVPLTAHTAGCIMTQGGVETLITLLTPHRADHTTLPTPQQADQTGLTIHGEDQSPHTPSTHVQDTPHPPMARNPPSTHVDQKTHTPPSPFDQTQDSSPAAAAAATVSIAAADSPHSTKDSPTAAASAPPPAAASIAAAAAARAAMKVQAFGFLFQVGPLCCALLGPSLCCALSAPCCAGWPLAVLCAAQQLGPLLSTLL